MITIRELENLAEDFMYENYNIKPYFKIEFNKKFKNIGGRYLAKTYNKPMTIQISYQLCELESIETIKKVLFHECIHLALHFLGKDYKDGDYYFENELKKHNLPSSAKTIKTKALSEPLEFKGYKEYSFSCSCKNHVVFSYNKNNYKHKICIFCKGLFRYNGEIRMINTEKGLKSVVIDYENKIEKYQQELGKIITNQGITEQSIKQITRLQEIIKNIENMVMYGRDYNEKYLE